MHIEQQERLREGVYTNVDQSQSLLVKSTTIEFNVLAVHQGRQWRVYEEHGYDLLETGQIAISGSSNDSSFIVGIAIYRWYWNGERIIRKGTTGEPVEFSHEHPPSPKRRAD